MFLTKKPVVTCPFRYVSKKKPSPWAAGYHPGVDFKAFLLTPIYAPAKSKIIHSGKGGWGSAYGKHIIGESVGTDGKTYRWIAAHLTTAAAKVGTTIAAGTRIGLSGNTGNTFGPHLHFEVRKAPYGYWDHVNPAVILNVTAAKPTPVTKPKPAPKPKPKPKPVVVPELLFQTEAYTINVNGKNATTFARRAKILGKEIKTAAPSILMAQECYIGIRGLLKKQLPGNLHMVGSKSGKVIWIDPGVWSFKRESVKTFSLGNGKTGISVLLTHRATGYQIVASTAHLVVGSKRGVDRIAEMRRWAELLVKFYGDTPKILGADFNDERISSGGPRREAINRHGYHAPESDVLVANIVHGQTDSYNGYKTDAPANGEHIDGFLLTQELFATRLRIDTQPAPQGSDHYGIEVRFGPRS